MTTKKEKIKVVELFAGVGGFRLGLEGHKSNKKTHHKHFETVWFNQWEPSTKKQHAHETYVARFNHRDEDTDVDIAKVTEKVPQHDLLVGGFPCQDYSVAKNLSASIGMEGKKGVLWWSIYEILLNHKRNGHAPKYVLLENVDRLLGSPAKQRGRDFAVILSCLNNLGYAVEWRIINAADYGFPQRRRRVFILAYRKGSEIYNHFDKVDSIDDWLLFQGLSQKAFPFKSETGIQHKSIPSDPVEITNSFNIDSPTISPFLHAGIAHHHSIHTTRAIPDYSGPFSKLKDFLVSDSEVPEEYYIRGEDLKRWEYLKGAKKEERTAGNGYKFIYSEGAVAFPDPLDKPSRTIITSEGGVTPSRFKHVVKTKKGLRRLTPIELERLCMFPDNHTEGHSDTKRAFFMGNALVVGVIDKFAEQISKFHFE